MSSEQQRHAEPITETGQLTLDDDSEGYDEAEREYVRRHFFPTFEWLDFDAPSPRNRLRKPLGSARIGLISTAGAHLPGQRPMGPGGSIRSVPADAEEIELTHEGYDTVRAGQDPEVVFPARTLLSLAAERKIGSLAPLAVSLMGYIPEGRRVYERTLPAAHELLASQDVDLALLIPA